MPLSLLNFVKTKIHNFATNLSNISTLLKYLDKPGTLTGKQYLFCKHYALTQNASDAAIKAGYAAKSAAQNASALLNNPNIQSYLATLQTKAVTKLDVSRERLIQEYAKIALSDIRTFYNEAGELLKPHELGDDAARAVQAIEVEEIYDGTGPDRRQIGYTKRLKLWSKTGALDSLCKLLGYNEPDKLLIAGQLTSLPAQLTIEELRKLAGEIGNNPGDQVAEIPIHLTGNEAESQ
jgi:phage terminase small subunit